MRQLSPLDVQFLNVETDTTFAHVGCLVVLEPGPDGPLGVDALRARIGARLPDLGPLRWRLHGVPLGLDLPYWEEVEPDLAHHVREETLPGSGDDGVLCRRVGELASVPLDRAVPLWQVTLLHGLTDGRQAVYLKVHHSAVDGVSVGDVLGVLTDEAPDAPDAREPGTGAGSVTAESAGGGPSTLGALGRAAWNVASRSAGLVRSAPRLVPHLLDLPGAVGVPGVGTVVGVVSRLSRSAGIDVPGVPDETPPTPPHTPFNGPLTVARGLGIGSVPLAEVKALKESLGLTVNDVVLATCATALRRWLLSHDALPTDPLVVAVPVSVRSEAEAGTGGNKVSIMLVELPTDEAEPAERVRRVHDAVQGAKERFAAVPASLLEEWSAALPQLAGGLASRTLMRFAGSDAPVFNLFVSNVPGPQHPLYCSGALVSRVHPVSAVSDVGGGINITVMSYDGHVDLGIVVCDDMVPDVDALAGYVTEALGELTELAELAAARS